MTYNQLTTEEFIERSKQLHGDKYDYSKVEYKNANTRVCIICPIHGEFWQKPSIHMQGRGCYLCGVDKRTNKLVSNKEEFIKQAKQLHGDKYDYSKVEYKNCKVKVCIICPEHGEFWQTPQAHLRGQGCNLCSKPIHDTNSFIIEAKKIHGEKYDYSKVEYIDAHTKVCIICPEHGQFWQTPNHHVSKKSGCPKCGKDRQQTNNKERNKKAAIDFEKKAKIIHGNKYDYSKVEYINNHIPVCIICPEHGEFWQKPMKHLTGHGCLRCSESKLETMVRVMLEENNIEYIQECDYNIFKWLKKQRLDFYIPEYNVAIECQGEQHYSPVSFGSLSKAAVRERFKNIIKYDKRKKENCEKNNIKLLYFTTEALKKNDEYTDLKELLNEIKKYE